MKNRQVYWRRSGSYYRGLRVADNHCIYAEVPVVHYLQVSGVICMMYGDIRWVADLVDAGKSRLTRQER